MRPSWILLATYGIVVAYAFPGYMNWDAGEQLHQARTGEFTDWYPPVMAECWRIMEFFVRGPLGMMLAQTALFLWGLHAILSTRFPRHVAAWLAAVVMLFPPVLTPMAAVWKDAQMAGFLIAGIALVLRPRTADRVVGVALLVLGTAMRDNAPATLPPLCLFVCAAWGFRRRHTVVIAAVALCLAVIMAATLANKALTRTRLYPWYRSVAIMDIAGTICHAGPMSDHELGVILAGTGRVDTPGIQAKICALYTPRVWFSLGQGDARYWIDPPDKTERLERREAWLDIVRAHPVAYLEHRWAVMAEVLGLTENEIWEPVCQTVDPNPSHRDEIHHDFTLSWFQRTLGAIFGKLGRTMVYRPWVYAVLSLFFCGYAIARRDAFIAAVVGSGLCYELSYFVGAAAPDFRYSHWMVLCCVMAGSTIFLERLTARWWQRHEAGRVLRPPSAVENQQATSDS